jgi:hypothetical protein
MSNTQPEEEVPPEALQPEACASEFSTKVKTVPEVVGRKKNSVVTQEGMGRNKEGRGAQQRGGSSDRLARLLHVKSDFRPHRRRFSALINQCQPRTRGIPPLARNGSDCEPVYTCEIRQANANNQ